MDQPEQVAAFVQHLFLRALQKHLAIRLQPVEFLPQAGERNHRRAAAQLRVTEHESQHGDKQIPFGQPQHLERVARTQPHQHLQHRNRAVLAAGRIKGEIEFGQLDLPNRRAELGSSALGDSRERFPVHFRRGAHVKILHPFPASAAGASPPPGAGCSSGSDTVKVAPAPAALLTSISPPCAWMMP